MSTTLRQAVALGWELVETDGAPRSPALVAAWGDMTGGVGVDPLDPGEADDTARVLRRCREGDPPEIGGTDAGAAVRAVVLGIVTLPDPMAQLVEAVGAITALTHDTRLGQASAAAVAAAVSSGLGGVDDHTCLGLALMAADLAAERGVHVPGPDLATRVQWATSLVARVDEDPEAILDVLVGTGPIAQEAVPAAFALVALHADDPWQACRSAAALGGDSPAIGAMAGAVLGARHGIDAFPASSVDRLLATRRELRLLDLADALAGLRCSAASASRHTTVQLS